MREESELRQSLRDGTALVIQAAEGVVTIPDFVERYGSFWYYEALDGHEDDDAGRSLLRNYVEVIEAHEKVQRKVVDVTFLGPEEQLKQYMDAGRIDLACAKSRLNEIISAHHLRDHLVSLST